MKFPLIAFALLLVAVSSSASVMAKSPNHASQPPPIRQGMMSGSGGYSGYMPSMAVRLHVGPRMISLGTFTYVMGRDETSPTYQLLRTVEK